MKHCSVFLFNFNYNLLFEISQQKICENRKGFFFKIYSNTVKGNIGNAVTSTIDKKSVFKLFPLPIESKRLFSIHLNNTYAKYFFHLFFVELEEKKLLYLYPTICSLCLSFSLLIVIYLKTNDYCCCSVHIWKWQCINERFVGATKLSYSLFNKRYQTNQ